MTNQVFAVAEKGWNDEAAEVAVTNHKQGVSLENIASELGTSVPSVRSKLVALGEYNPPERKAVGGASKVRKAHMVAEIAEKLGLAENGLESLEKANRDDLNAMLKMLQDDEE